MLLLESETKECEVKVNLESELRKKILMLRIFATKTNILCCVFHKGFLGN